MYQELLYLLLGLGSALGTGMVTLATLYMTRDKRTSEVVATMTNSVDKMATNMDTLITERERNTRLISELRGDFEVQRIKHQHSLDALREELRKESQDQLDEVRLQHLAQLKVLEERHQSEMTKLRQDLQAAHQSEMDALRIELRQEHQAEMERLQKNHQLEMDKLAQSHKTQMDELKKHHANEIKRLNEQILSLEKTLGNNFQPQGSNGDSALVASDSHLGTAEKPVNDKSE